jgi:hypothetical protein
LSTDKSLNVATPPTATTVVVPDNVAPPGLELKEIVIGTELPVTTFPDSSCTVTVIGAKTAPATTVDMTDDIDSAAAAGTVVVVLVEVGGVVVVDVLVEVGGVLVVDEAVVVVVGVVVVVMPGEDELVAVAPPAQLLMAVTV